MLIWCSVIKYCLASLRHQQKIFSCPVRMSPLEVTSTNYSRSPMFHAHGLTFSVNVLYINAWNFLPDIVDFSSLSRFKRSIHKVDFSRFLKCFKVFFNIILYFVLLVGAYILCISVFFFLKGHYKSLS